MTHIRQSMLFSYALLYFHSEITEVFETKALHDRKIQTYFQCLEILSFKDNHPRGCYDCPFLLDLWVSWAGLSLSMWFKNAGLTQYPTEATRTLIFWSILSSVFASVRFNVFICLNYFPELEKYREHTIFSLFNQCSPDTSQHTIQINMNLPNKQYYSTIP